MNRLKQSAQVQRRSIMHHWDDKNVDWEGINDAAQWIGDQLNNYSEDWTYQIKEKWGYAVVYCATPHDLEAEKFYRATYMLAIEKWPHLKQEILGGADYKEYLEGI